MRDVDLDRVLDRARPSSAADDPRARELAVLLAQQIAAAAPVPTVRRKHRAELIGGIGLTLVLLGGAAAAATPLLMEWPPWESDAVIERVFPVSGGADAACVVIARVTPDAATAGPDQESRLDHAREFLETHDWSAIETMAIGDIPPEDLVGPRRQGLTDQTILTTQVSDQVGQAFESSGHLGDGVSLELAARCGQEAQG